MNKKQKNIQWILGCVGILLILVTYFYYPSINKNAPKENVTADENTETTYKIDEKETTAFKNVEYRGVYDFDKNFKVKSEEAYILYDEPDVVYMTNMHVILYLSRDRVVNIFSNKGKYNKITYDCFFEENVKALDGTTEIFADNMDLLATSNSAEIYNNVTMNNVTGLLKADKVDYDFDTKLFKVTMYNDKRIKMKVFR